MAIAVCIRANQKPRSEFKRKAPQLIFWVGVVRGMTIAVAQKLVYCCNRDEIKLSIRCFTEILNQTDRLIF
jgi:hypothetical protein